MTDELSVIELIMGASFTVKLVMAILVAASVTSWFMIVQRVIILQRADAELLDFVRSILVGHGLGTALSRGVKCHRRGDGYHRWRSTFSGRF